MQQSLSALRRVLGRGALPKLRAFSTSSLKDALSLNDASAQRVQAKIAALKKDLECAKAELLSLQQTRADLQSKSQPVKALVTKWIGSALKNADLPEEGLSSLRARLKASLKSVPLTAGTHTIYVN